jgi:hypothetical protein
MMTLRILLPAIMAFGLAACGGQPGETAGNGEGHAMHDSAVNRETPALPDEGIVPSIDVQVAWMRPHPEGRDVTAAYFAARLAEGSADRLLAARIEGAGEVELHGHTMNDQGMMQMRAIGPQEVTSGTPLVFTPGGRHLMVFGLAPVSEGDSVAGVLVFERAGEVQVTFEVQSAPPGLPEE